jgi:uncharacterized Zn-finger protein
LRLFDSHAVNGARLAGNSGPRPLRCPQFSPLNKTRRGDTGPERMTDNIVPHFHNDPGVPVIEIGATEFMCVGAKPPFDHPHIFCDMGNDAEYICPYCSTLYRHDPALAPDAARPAECALDPAAAA